MGGLTYLCIVCLGGGGGGDEVRDGGVNNQGVWHTPPESFEI